MSVSQKQLDHDDRYENPVPLRPRDKDVDLSEFAAMGKMPWEKRVERIKERFPSIDQLDWNKALENDIDLFGRIMRDILKLEQAVPGRPGPRPSLDVFSATRRLQQWFGNDFTIDAFPEALKTLARSDRVLRQRMHGGEIGYRKIAKKVQLQPTVVFRLLSGQTEPDGYVMRMCAHAFGKHPSYFLEWRILFIVAAVVRRLEWSPETSVSLFRKLDTQHKATELWL